MNITIGIPSYNEQNSIANLLAAIEAQHLDGHEIHEVIVADDSTDGTPDVVNDFAKRSRLNIRLMHNDGRRGTARAWNDIFENARGDAVVLYDADVIPDRRTTRVLAEGLNNNTALCAANPMPAGARNVAGRASSFNSAWLRRIRKLGLSKYTVMGRALSIRSEVARKVRIPDIVAIDLYLQCKVMEMGYGVGYRDDAVVWFRPANTMLDFASQVARAVDGHREIDGYVRKLGMDITASTMFGEAVKEAFSDPAGIVTLAISYIALPFYRSKMGNIATKSTWHVAGSTKGLSVDELKKYG